MYLENVQSITCLVWHVCACVCVLECVCVFVSSCLATKVFIGNLQASGRGWVIV